ncbi:MAG: hypothetical protein K8R28_02340 [Desulfobacterales bacterium]|nr:hypothetical protein [Desulfobacterales bacterium]
MRGKLHKFYQVIFDRALDDSMQYVKIGQKIRITFEGKTKNKWIRRCKYEDLPDQACRKNKAQLGSIISK